MQGQYTKAYLNIKKRKNYVRGGCRTVMILSNSFLRFALKYSGSYFLAKTGAERHRAVIKPELTSPYCRLRDTLSLVQILSS